MFKLALSNLTKCILFSAVFLFSLQSLANIDGYVGFGLGAADISLESAGGEDIYDPSSSIAFRVGIVFYEAVQFGIHLGSYRATAETNPGEETSVFVMPQLLELNYLFSGTRDGAYIGIAGGAVRETATTEILGTEISVSDSETVYGGTFGYNFQTGANHSFGVEAKYLQISGDPEDYNMWSLHGTWNYWF